MDERPELNASEWVVFVAALLAAFGLGIVLGLSIGVV